MKENRAIIRVILTAIGVILIINIVGFFLECSRSLGLLNIDIIRKLTLISSSLSLAFIISGIIFWINLFKLNKKALIWWHIFIGINLITVLYKIIKPTYLVTIIPYYFIISLSILLVIWIVVFKYLRKITKSASS